jgi:hypothetical protein
MIYDFETELVQERRDTIHPELKLVLRGLFPNATGMSLATLEMQLAGIDVVINDVFPVTVDFKFRRKIYPDFALEYAHEYKNGTKRPGWIADPKKTADFICYVFKPTWLAYLIPRKPLHDAWAANSAQWLERYGTTRTENTEWVTLWCPVPRTVVRESVPDILVADRLGLFCF